MGKIQLGQGLVKGLREAVAHEKGELNLRSSASMSKNDLISLEGRLNEIESRPIPEKVLEVIKEQHHHHTKETVVEKTETIVKEVSVITKDKRARQHSRAIRGHLLFQRYKLDVLQNLTESLHEDVKSLQSTLQDHKDEILNLQSHCKLLESKIPEENQELEKIKRIVIFLIIGSSLVLSLISLLK